MNGAAYVSAENLTFSVEDERQNADDWGVVEQQNADDWEEDEQQNADDWEEDEQQNADDWEEDEQQNADDWEEDEQQNADDWGEVEDNYGDRSVDKEDIVQGLQDQVQIFEVSDDEENGIQVPEVAPAAYVYPGAARTAHVHPVFAPAADIYPEVAHVRQGVAPAAHVFAEVDPVTHVHRLFAPAADIYPEVAPVAHVRQGVAPAAHVFAEVAPVAHAHRVFAPAADIYPEVAPVAHVRQGVAPAAHVLIEPQRAAVNRRVSLPMVAEIPLPESPPPVCNCMRVHGNLDQILREANLAADGLDQLRIMADWPYPVLRDHLLDFGLLELGEKLCRLTLLTRVCTYMEEMEIAMIGTAQAVAEAARTPRAVANAVPQPQEQPQEIPAHEDPLPIVPFQVLPPDTPVPKQRSEPWLGICVICMENERDYAIVPCGHISCCTQCGDSDLLVTCPICREPIEKVLKVVLS